MANRARTYDEQVHSLKDLQRLGSEKLVKSTRGKCLRLLRPFRNTDNLLRILQ